MRKIIIILTMLLLSLATNDINAQYKIKKGVFGSSKPAAGGAYKVNGTLSQDNVGVSTGGSYQVKSGFWEPQVINPLMGLPTVVMDSLKCQSYYSGTCYTRITNMGNSAVIRRGICWSTLGTPTVNDYKSEEIGNYGVSSFATVMNGLTPTGVYHVRAFAENSAGIAYSNEVTINTIPTLPEWGMIALGSLLVGMSVWLAVKKIV